MAKKRGISGTISAVWRLLIWGLAAVLVFAIWLGWSDRTAPPSETTAEALPEAGESADAATDAGEADPEETAISDEGDEADTETATTEDTTNDDAASVVDTIVGAVDEATQSDAEAATDEALEEIEEERTEPEAAGTAADTEATLGATPELEATDPAAGAVGETSSTLILTLLGDVELGLPGDEARYRLIDASRTNGRIEVTTSRSLNGETTETVRQLSCDPLSSGVVSTAGGARTEDPEMTPVEDGTPDAMIARAVCNALN